jgi:hypothetical protein
MVEMNNKRRRVLQLVWSFLYIFFGFWGLATNVLAQGQGQDCDSALLARTREIIVTTPPHGYGAIKEIPERQICLEEGEKNSQWYLLNIIQGGSLGFELISPGEDYDFALYKIGDGGCAAIGTQLPVRCNYSAASGRTGIDSSSASSLSLSYGQLDPPFMPGLNVSAGEIYLLLLNRFQALSRGYRLRITGTARISFPRSGPSVVAVDAPRCAETDTHEVVFYFNQALQCDSFQRQYISILPPQGGAGVQIISASCSNGLSGELRLRYVTPSPISGRYIFRYQAPSGQGLRSADNFRVDTLTAPYTVSRRPSAEFVASSSRVCSNEIIQLRYVGNSGSLANFVWDTDPARNMTPIAGGFQSYRVKWLTPGIKTISLTVWEGNCVSPPFSQTVVVYPVTPIIQGNRRCGPGRLTLTVEAPGLRQCTLRLFDNLVGGNLVATGLNLGNAKYSFALPIVTTSISFYLEGECQDIACSALASFRQNVAIIVDEAPPAPVVLSTKAKQCGSGVVALELVPNFPFDLFLEAYSDSVGSTPIPFQIEQLSPTTTLLFSSIRDSQLVYISYRHPLTGCESQRIRATLKNIQIPSAPQIVSKMQICGAQTVTLSPLMGSIKGEGIKLFSQCQFDFQVPFTGDNALVASSAPPYALQTPPITTTTTFALAAFSRGSDFTCSGGDCPPCYSVCSFVVIEVLPLPRLLSLDSLYAVCQGQLFSYPLNEVEQGTTINIYKEGQGLTPALQLKEPPYTARLALTETDSVLYFEAQKGNSTGNNCVGARQKMKIQTLSLPPSPLITAAPRCGWGKVQLTVQFPADEPAKIYLARFDEPSYPIDSSEQKLWRTQLWVQDKEANRWLAVARSKQTNCQSLPAYFSIPIDSIPSAPDSLGVLRLDNAYYLIFWQPVVEADAYEYSYRLKGTPWGAPMRVDTHVVRLSNLLENQKYEFRARSLCRDTFSRFSSVYEFSTAPNSRPKSEPALSFFIFPNPTQAHFWLSAPLGTDLKKLALMDNLGKVVVQSLELVEAEPGLTKWSLPALAPGVYSLLVEGEQKRIYLRLVIGKE